MKTIIAQIRFHCDCSITIFDKAICCRSDLVLLFLSLLFISGCQNSPKKDSKANRIKIDTTLVEAKIAIKQVMVDYDSTVWAEIVEGNGILLDIRYATTDNFTKEIIYDCGRCFLRKASADVFDKIIGELKTKGYGVKLFDCYRPQAAQYKLWEIVPNPMYVADPKKGSMHNRGLALDLTLTTLDGTELDMGTAFDFFGKRAYHDFLDLPADMLKRRKILRETMAKFGFKHTRTEWWHYSDAMNKAVISNFQWPCAE